MLSAEDTIALGACTPQFRKAMKAYGSGHPIAAENGDYTVVSVEHEAKDPRRAGGPGY
ncbi:hypothetical protein [Inquilinus sp. OTU3971]|uniref:hypothetical protein n=1 Tax=Inquilinus sp. OTU3971 TaxID=3043855 RepID=UPI00313CB2CD